MYSIEIQYETGDSFGSSTEKDVIEHQWEDIQKAKESLKRIKNHHEYYGKYENMYKKPKHKLPVGVVWANRTITLELISDSGKPFNYYPFWVGYFETLYGAKIIPEKDNDMEFTANSY